MSRPNVILIMADDMGYGDLGCVNGGINTTPNLDQLYQESTRLTQGYAASCVCAPSRAGFLTGRYPIRTGCVCLNDAHALNRLAVDEVTIADLFQASGYHTGLIGKWHCGTISGSRPEDRGFTHVETFHPQQKDYWNWSIDCNGTEVPSDGRYLTDYLTERTVNFVRENHGQPFFLHLAYYAPHRPLQAPEELLERYRDREDLTPGQAVVYAMIESMDQGIGKIMEALKESGISDNTIVIFTSDNGPDDQEVGGLSPVRSNVGLRGQKYSVHDGGIRVPFIIRWPDRLEAGVDRHELFHFVDILPTLASACGVEVPDNLQLDGKDCFASWQSGIDTAGAYRFWQWNRYHPIVGCNAAMRDGDWKLVIPAKDGHRRMIQADIDIVQGRRPLEITPPETIDLGEGGSPMLFNIVDDPCEQEDLADRYRHRTNEMSTELDNWFHQVCAELDVILDKRFPQQ